MAAMHGRKPEKKKVRPLVILAIVLFVTGVGIFVYPYISEYKYANEAVQGYEEFITEIAQTEAYEEPSKDGATTTAAKKDKLILTKYAELYKLMQEYNVDIDQKKQKDLNEPGAYQALSFDLTQHGLKQNIIAYIQIPSIDLILPIYLGATNENMALGAAHLSQTSLPIGGVNTNCVLCGHKGYTGKIFFDRILELKEGDEVIITNLWQTLSYRVTSTTTILDNDVESLKIQDGKDMLSLFTCYYQQGRKDRFVVFCERNTEEA